MHLRVYVTAREEGWDLELNGLARGSVGRRLGAVHIGSSLFPVPPQDEVEPDAQELFAQLCRGRPALAATYARIVTRQPQTGEVEAFGRYLWATLLGSSLWKEILDEAGDSEIGLQLEWDPSAAALNRLPWEMMHDGLGFLALHKPPVAITRVVEVASNGGPQTIPTPLKVLFVVGADLSDQEIQAGAEYLGLLRRLNQPLPSGKVFGINDRLLLLATSQKLEDTCRRFRPSVVHFICHGSPGEGEARPYLELRSQDTGHGAEPFDGGRLVDLLGACGHMPIVVLNACYSATTLRRYESELTALAGLPAAPLAVELVQKGAPLVVGMTGPVSDRACRLFTWGFYEALLEGVPVPVAVARGRRAGMVHGADPRSTVDWGFPALFLSTSVSSNLQIEEPRHDIRLIINGYRAGRNPRAFCDRLDLAAKFQDLMDVFPGPTVLAIESVEQGGAGPKFGKTRVLKELMMRAVYDGHVPCELSFGYDDPPDSPLLLVQEILKSVARTRSQESFNLPANDRSQIHKLMERVTSCSSCRLDERVERMLDDLIIPPRSLDELPSYILAEAVRADLAQLQEDAREVLGCPTLRVLVFIDDLHRFGLEALRWLVQELVTQHGLGPGGAPVPLVFTYSTPREEYGSALGLLKDFVETSPTYLEYYRLQAFPRLEAWLAYRQYLLFREEPLVVRAPQHQEQGFFEELDAVVQGIPSRLREPNVEVERLIRFGKKVTILTEADDEVVMRRIAEERHVR